MKRELWKEFISESLEETNEKLTDKAIDNIIDCVETTIENMWMIDGRPEGRSPDRIELEEVNKRHKEEIASLEQQILTYRNSVAVRRNVPIEDVEIEDNTVIYGHSL